MPAIALVSLKRPDCHQLTEDLLTKLTPRWQNIDVKVFLDSKML